MKNGLMYVIYLKSFPVEERQTIETTPTLTAAPSTASPPPPPKPYENYPETNSKADAAENADPPKKELRVKRNKILYQTTAPKVVPGLYSTKFNFSVVLKGK